MRKAIAALIIIGWLTSCSQNPGEISIPIPRNHEVGNMKTGLSDSEYKDRILGAIVGSAIGDAMGASTEMWSREDIQKNFGYITGLTDAIRVKSPEGTWLDNMQSGATTDDTRWKVLFAEYLINNKEKLSGLAFSEFTTDYYNQLTSELSELEQAEKISEFDHQIERIDWIKEWAVVADGYQKGLPAYNVALHQFYGGEMSCAGMLYAPMIGLVSPTVNDAYLKGFDHVIYDIGYAKDISSMTAAMTRAALEFTTFDSVLAVIHYVDPYDFRGSRLIGRLAYNQALEVMDIVKSAQNMDETEVEIVGMPKGYNGTSTDWAKQVNAYDQLEERFQDIPFHAGEIWQIMYAGLAWGNGDFQKTMEFIVNCGRDNDTVAAVAGMILGAHLGYSKLPEDLKTKVVEVNKEFLGLDLERVAEKLFNTFK